MFVLEFSLRKNVQLDGFSLFLFCLLIFMSSWFRCFLALYNLAMIHLDLTFGGLWLDFLDTCLFKTLLEGFYTRTWAVKNIVHGHFLINAVSYMVAVHLMRRGWLPYLSFFFSSLFSTKLPLSPWDCTVLPSFLISTFWG